MLHRPRSFVAITPLMKVVRRKNKTNIISFLIASGIKRPFWRFPLWAACSAITVPSLLRRFKIILIIAFTGCADDFDWKWCHMYELNVRARCWTVQQVCVCVCETHLAKLSGIKYYLQTERRECLVSGIRVCRSSYTSLQTVETKRRESESRSHSRITLCGWPASGE